MELDISQQMETDIQQLKKDLQKEIVSRSHPKSLYGFLYKKSLEGKLERLEQLESVLSIDKYKLVFIGTVGAGKTTAICHLFNLIGEFEVTEKAKKIKKVQELLATGSGFTTICEVIIKSTDKTFISIEPYSEEELKDLISSFAEFIDMKLNPSNYSDTASSKGVNIISPEIDRALRNILNLKKRDKDETVDGGKKKTSVIDEADEVAKQFTSLDNFKEELFKRADFGTRSETKLVYETGSESEWVKKTFEDINVAKNRLLSIPKKIFLHLSNKILIHSHFSNFSEIIDMKGLDANKFRKDIDNYVNQEDAICLFTTRFPNAPDSDILEQMQRHLSFKSKKFHQRFITFVMPRQQEPENIISSEGTAVNDWEEGINIRRNTIQDIFTQQSIEFLPDNIIFYDSLRYYYNGRLNANENYTLDDINQDRNEIVEMVNNIIQNRIQQSKEEVIQIQRDFQSIQSGTQQITEEEEELLQNIQINIKSFIHLNFVNSADFIDWFVSYYRNHYHHFTKHAINRRFGIYDERDFDVYNDAYELTIDLVRKNTEDFKNKIIQVIKNSSSELHHSDLETFIDEILSQLEIFYDKFLKKIGQTMHDEIYLDKFFPKDLSSDFWFNVINRRGKGSGYTDDVCNMFANQLDGINEKLKQTTEDYWQSMVIGKTLEFFGQS